jgi:hypothetical protein
MHYKDGACPRWANKQLDQTVRILVRLGKKWPEREGHRLVYFVDQVDRRSGMVPVWDLDASDDGETVFDAEVITARTSGRQRTTKATSDQRMSAAEEVEQAMGQRVVVVKAIV